VPADGIVRDQLVREAVLADVSRWFDEQGWEKIGAIESPIAGKQGNREYLLAGRKPAHVGVG
jgi:23S rRNA (cytidine1920-2'-O)/16S rRNA (cytidine1409-2'-O)-methyltransferase